jgi:hypothetical protein
MTSCGPPYQEIIVRPDVVGFVKVIRCQDKANRAVGKIVKLTPNPWTYVQTVVGAVQVDALFSITVIQKDIEAAGGCYYKLMQILVGMPAPCRTTWDIIEVVDTLNRERYMPVILDKCKIAKRIANLGQLNCRAPINTHR